MLVDKILLTFHPTLVGYPALYTALISAHLLNVPSLIFKINGDQHITNLKEISNGDIRYGGTVDPLNMQIEIRPTYPSFDLYEFAFSWTLTLAPLYYYDITKAPKLTLRSGSKVLYEEIPLWHPSLEGSYITLSFKTGTRPNPSGEDVQPGESIPFVPPVEPDEIQDCKVERNCCRRNLDCVRVKDL